MDNYACFAVLLGKTIICLRNVIIINPVMVQLFAMGKQYLPALIAFSLISIINA